MTRLSERQLDILRRLAGGDTALHLLGWGGTVGQAWWHRDIGTESIDLRSLFSLEKRGLVRLFEKNWNTRYYHISQKGREALGGIISEQGRAPEEGGPTD